MYLLKVDDGLPERVLLLVEVPHTNLTEVTRMVLCAVVSLLFLLSLGIPIASFFLGRVCEPCPCWYGGGADHQPDHDHRDACGACLHDLCRQKHGRDYVPKLASKLHPNCHQRGPEFRHRR